MLLSILFLDQFEQLFAFMVNQCLLLLDKEGSSARLVLRDDSVAVKDLIRALNGLFPSEVVRVHESSSFARELQYILT